MKIRRLFYAVVCLCCSLGVDAARLERPYGVDMPVASQSAGERAKASVSGLEQLLLKLTGQSVGDNAIVKERLASGVDKYILQYSYEKGTEAGGYLPASAFLLRLSFSQTAVLQLLHDAAIPVWPLDRPRVLLLMLDAQGNWMPAAEQQLLATQLRQLGLFYGVPVSVPLLDLQDQAGLQAQAVQTADAAALQPAVNRYQADALLTGVVRGDDAVGWQGQWTLQFREQKIPVAKQAATLPALLDALFIDLAGQLSGQYRSSVSHDSSAASVLLQVEEVNSYAEYIQLRNAVQKLEAVKRLGVVRVEGTTVTMAVDVAGQESFRSLLALNKQLQAADAAVAESVPPVVGSAPVAAGNALPADSPAPVAGNTAPVAGDPVPATPVIWRYRWVP